MLPKTILSYKTTVAITLLTQLLVGALAAQIPLGIWNGKPTSDGIAMTDIPHSNYRYKFTLPQRISGEKDGAHDRDDELTISWDADPGVKPATFHIQCWSNEPVVYNDTQSIDRPTYSRIIELPWWRIGPAKSHTVHLHPYREYHLCRFVLQDTEEKELAALGVLMDDAPL